MGDVAVEYARADRRLEAPWNRVRLWWLPSVVISLVVLAVGDVGFYYLVSGRVIESVGFRWVIFIYAFMPLVAGAVPLAVKLRGRRGLAYVAGVILGLGVVGWQFYTYGLLERNYFFGCAVLLFVIAVGREVKPGAGLRVVGYSGVAAVLFAWSFYELSDLLRLTAFGASPTLVTREFLLQLCHYERVQRYLLLILLWLFAWPVGPGVGLRRVPAILSPGLVATGFIILAATGYYVLKPTLAEFSVRRGFPLSPEHAYAFLTEGGPPDERAWRLLESTEWPEQRDRDHWTRGAIVWLIDASPPDHGRLLRLIRAHPGSDLIEDGARHLTAEELREFLPQIVYRALFLGDDTCVQILVPGEAKQGAWVVLESVMRKRRMVGNPSLQLEAQEVGMMLRCMRVELAALLPAGQTEFTGVMLTKGYWEGVLKEKARGVSPGFEAGVCAKADQVVALHGMFMQDCERLDAFWAAKSAAAAATRPARIVTCGFGSGFGYADWLMMGMGDTLAINYGVTPPEFGAGDLGVVAREISAFHARVDAYCGVGR